MSFKDLNIKLSYISQGEESIAKAFLNPVLKKSILYRRSVGFFSSGVFNSIIDGIVGLVRNNGKMEIIASPHLTDEDIKAISLGYKKRDEIINSTFSKDFIMEIEKLDDEKLQLLVKLIAEGILDIKIAVTHTDGIYHDKLGILEDQDHNIIVFYGSANESYSGYEQNYEKIRIIKNWDQADFNKVEDECQEFETLWSGTNPFITIYEYKECAKNNILKVIEARRTNNMINDSVPSITLRDYQIEAISSWVANNYHGFYVMATGTGKTWTAIFSAKELLKKQSAMVVICAPYKHLIKQWAEDVNTIFPNAKIVLVSSENPNWDEQIVTEIIHKKYDSSNQLIIISTIKSFNSQKFFSIIARSNEKKLLIVDEAHRFTDRSDSLKTVYDYMLGLSATPYSGTSSQRGQELMNWFGGQVYNLPIEIALQKGFLVPYFYHPIYVCSTNDEEEQFKRYTKSIISCFKNNKCINKDRLVTSLKGRLRIISIANEKNNKIDQIIQKIKDRDHFIVYCGDGKLFDEQTGEEIKHIQSIKKVLNTYGFKTSQFTAKENIKERMELVDAFNKQEITTLVAIRCLDEGINIPSIKSALILSSNDDYREFVQRRGRILRRYLNKKNANIYDVVVLPSHDLQSWAKIEFRRFYEYAKLALNWDELKQELTSFLNIYKLTIEDINVYEFEEIEDNTDE